MRYQQNLRGRRLAIVPEPHAGSSTANLRSHSRNARSRRSASFRRFVRAAPGLADSARSNSAAIAMFAQVEPEAPRPAETWIDRLLDTNLFAAQRKQAARTSLPEERIRAILSVLDARGGKLTGGALAERLGVPLFRLGGIVSALRRILNVEGYDVLSVDDSSETIELNRELLETQFGLAGDGE